MTSYQIISIRSYPQRELLFLWRLLNVCGALRVLSSPGVREEALTINQLLSLLNFYERRIFFSNNCLSVFASVGGLCAGAVTDRSLRLARESNGECENVGVD